MGKHFRRLLNIALAIFIFAISLVPISNIVSAKSQISEINRGIFIESGYHSSFIVDSDGKLWAWGLNQYGKLGNSSIVDVNVPIYIMDNIVSVASGESHTLVVKTDGSLWTFGWNRFGQLGNGTTSFNTQFSPIKIMENVRSVYASGNSSMAIKNDNSLWVWGRNDFGQVGIGSKYIISISTPTKILDDVAEVSSNGISSFAVKHDGSLWGWGDNSRKIIKDSDDQLFLLPEYMMNDVSGFSVGNFHALALRFDNSLWAWGSNTHGQIGDGTTESSFTPIKILEDVRIISSGSIYSIAIKNDDSLWAWGYNFDGQIGDGNSGFDSDGRPAAQLEPIKVMNNVEIATAKSNHTLVLSKEGSLYAWGYNNYGQLGDDTNTSKSLPVSPIFLLGSVQILVESDISDIFTYSDSSFAIKPDSSLFAWGRNSEGQLGDGTIVNRLTEVMIINDVKKVSSSFSHTLAIRSDGSLWAWGRNNYGQLGLGYTSDPQLSPIKVMDDILAVSAGDNYTFILKKDSSLWGFGYNAQGQLGDGTTTNRLVPTKILEDVKMISAGSFHAFAIKNDGSLWGWGENSSGRLGDGTTIRRVRPVHIMSDVKFVTAGNNATGAAITNNNSLWMWGANTSGQLGDGTTTTKHSPIKVFDNVLMVALGSLHSSAIKNDGSLWLWGENSHGRLGDGTTTRKLSPTMIMNNVKKVALGSSHSSVIKEDGSLWTWGENASGQLANGETSNSLFPLKIKSADLFREISTIDEVNIPIFSGAPNFFFNFLFDKNALFRIVDQDIPNNFNFISKNHLVASQVGNATIEVTNSAGNILYHVFNVTSYNKKPSFLSGTPYNTISNRDVKIYILNGLNSTLNNQFFLEGVISNEGRNTLLSQDLGGFFYQSYVHIDKTPPVITVGEYTTTPTNQDITVSVTTNEGILNQEFYIFTENGSFTFIATDEAGNITEETVTITNIDKTLPIVEGIKDQGFYNTNRIIVFDKGQATLNGVTIESGFEVFQEGNYELNVIDEAGNNVIISFTIDKTYPEAYGVENNKIYNSSRVISFNEGFATLNGKFFASGSTVVNEGEYILVLTDFASNSVTIIFSIDKTAPVITVGEYTTTPTNQDITVSVTTNEGILNQQSYTFTENGSFTFIATDEAGNISEKVVIITNIDKVPPAITIGDYVTTPTNQDITVSVAANEGILNQESYTFTENGSFTFIVTDEAENTTEETVTITNIDKIAPIITINEYIIDPTNQDITVSVATNEGILNQESYIFTENGSFTFIATDEAGNITEKTVTITNIDKTLPIVEGIKDQGFYNTNRIIVFDKGQATLNGVTIESGFEVFQEGNYELNVIDEAGNNVTISFVIDKIQPVITLVDYITTPINQDITVSVTTNEGTLNKTSHTFTENGSFTFIATDKAGNITEETVTITNIDKVTPIITVGNYIKTPTNQDITVTVSTNEGSLNKSSHTFTENGSFTFIATDKAGNVTKETVTISNIDKVAPIITVGNYIKTPTNQDITVTVSTNEGSLNKISHTFTENGSFTFIATDEAGNTTEETVTITNIDKIAPIITINEYIIDPTNQDITVSVATNEGIINQESYIFTENGSFTFIATDEAGNITEKTVTITNIDKAAPIITV